LGFGFSPSRFSDSRTDLCPVGRTPHDEIVRALLLDSSFLGYIDQKRPMPRNSDLAEASAAIFNAGQIVTSAQVVAIFQDVPDEPTKTLLARLFEAVQFQNEALERLRLAIEKVDKKNAESQA
jgi:hypothetical protein